MTERLPHLNAAGEVHMVNVGEKPVSERLAIAQGRLLTTGAVTSLARSQNAPKGDVLAVARVAAIVAVKNTAQWIPLAHPIAVTGIAVDIAVEEESFMVTVEVKSHGPTGVEMEALTGVSAGLLTLYDMLKAQDRGMTMTDIRLMHKSGGKSGVYQRGGQGDG